MFWTLQTVFCAWFGPRRPLQNKKWPLGVTTARMAGPATRAVEIDVATPMCGLFEKPVRMRAFVAFVALVQCNYMPMSISSTSHLRR
ncbi:hypothetical protein BN2475_450079 [Paraburkholderia ribeironis]|uniref:Uncharacterized protein n=1 Tax=Paraburkholderia ribeironis TaxID=1247936 RepID=A0A1N7S8Z7_9BURK|nr:hypothetical protein BN2475_450079 [Paraburkholderia ribeironis]